MSLQPVYSHKTKSWHCPQCNSTQLAQILLASLSRPLKSEEAKLTTEPITPEQWVLNPHTRDAHCLQCGMLLDLTGIPISEHNTPPPQPITWNETDQEWQCPHCGCSSFSLILTADNTIEVLSHNHETLYESDDYIGQWENIRRHTPRCNDCDTPLAIPPSLDIVEESQL